MGVFAGVHTDAVNCGDFTVDGKQMVTASLDASFALVCHWIHFFVDFGERSCLTGFMYSGIQKTLKSQFGKYRVMMVDGIKRGSRPWVSPKTDS